jgi:dihydropyrimidinase
VIRLAENVEGAALYMVHVSAATGVAALESSRAEGFPMYGETLHQYLMYNAEDYKRPGGQMFHTYPSLKYPEDQKRLWEATNRGAIQVIATDELCCRCGSSCRAAGSTTRPAATRASSRGSG